MSKANTPTHFAGEIDHFYDPNFTAEISKKMRVPKRINVDGISDLPIVNQHWMPAEKLEMHVPDKIVVAGNEEHYGVRTVPREMDLDNSIMPPDPGIVRVQTPPRVITIDSQFYTDDYEPPPPSAFREILHRKQRSADPDHRLDLTSNSVNLNESMVVSDGGMTLNEEVVHLRRQLAKLNRRIMSIELENLQRQHRDKFIYALGLAYFFFKTVVWISRSSS